MLPDEQFAPDSRRAVSIRLHSRALSVGDDAGTASAGCGWHWCSGCGGPSISRCGARAGRIVARHVDGSGNGPATRLVFGGARCDRCLMLSLKRFAALAGAAVAIAAIVACTPVSDELATEPVSAEPAAEPASAEQTAPPAPPAAPAPVELATTPMPVDEYVVRFGVTDGDIYGPEGIEAVDAEYREAAQVFPLALPEGYSFPGETGLIGHNLPEGWQQGDGYAAAFSFWQKSTATAAFHDFLLNESADAEVHLNALVEGYESAVRAMYIDDPELAYLDEVVYPAYEGNYDALYVNDVNRFLGNDIYSAASERAGETFNLGTEGYAVAIP